MALKHRFRKRGIPGPIAGLRRIHPESSGAERESELAVTTNQCSEDSDMNINASLVSVHWPQVSVEPVERFFHFVLLQRYVADVEQYIPLVPLRRSQ